MRFWSYRGNLACIPSASRSMECSVLGVPWRQEHSETSGRGSYEVKVLLWRFWGYTRKQTWRSISRSFVSSPCPLYLEWSRMQEFTREVVVWRQLFHCNVLPFYGVYHLENDSSGVCLVSPWMENGSLQQFLGDFPNTDRIPLVCGYSFCLIGWQVLHIKSDIRSWTLLRALSTSIQWDQPSFMGT